MTNDTVFHRYFTLIELLITIAIIAVLFSILLPSLNSARCYAKRTCCLGNLKQIGMATLSYSDSYNGFLSCGAGAGWQPPFVQQLVSAEGRFNGSSDWHDYPDGNSQSSAAINPKNKIFGGCPSLSESPYRLQTHHPVGDYGFNITHPTSSNGVFALSAGKQWKLSCFLRPSSSMAFMDARSATSMRTNWYVRCICEIDNGVGYDPRHQGGCNMLLFDGHVEWHPSNWYLLDDPDVWGHKPSGFIR